MPLLPETVQLINQPVVLVTGMHRSGTSYLMRLIMQHEGSERLYFGPEPMFLPVSSEAAYGYQELRPIVNANTDMIHRARGSVHHPRRVRDLFPPLAVQHTVLSLLVTANGRPLVMKDPRFIATVGPWTYWLKNTKVVYLRREPANVVRSLMKRRGLTRFNAINSYDTHIALATECLPVGRTLMIHFNDLLAAPQETIDKVYEFIV